MSWSSPRRGHAEATQRAVASGSLPPIQCNSCGQRFWTQDQERSHRASERNMRYCLSMLVQRPNE